MSKKARKTKAKPVLPVPALRVDAARWPANRTEQRPVASLVPYARNARTHSPEQVVQIAASIAKWGWTMPVLVDEAGMLLAGHGRVLAAQRLGLVEVPVMVALGWSEADKRAYILADNRIAENAGWDKQLLGLELTALAGMPDVNMALLGFAQAELDEMIQFAERGGRVDENAAPAAAAQPVSQPGDVWLLGEHRLLCGDSTVAADVAALLAGERPHLMVTDPPYGVNYDPNWRNAAALNNGGGALGKVSNDDRADWRETWALFPGAVAYVWHGGLHAGTVDASLKAAGFGLRAQIVWVKTRPVISRGHYHWQHEPAFYAVRPGADDQWRFDDEHETAAYAVREGETGHWRGGRRQSTVWMIEHVKSETGHGTQKPVDCMKRPILNNSRPGDAVYEPFSGSGTTIIAAEMTGRRAFAIEIDPAYVDVAVRRWEGFTGLRARLAAGGLFEEVAAARGVVLSAAA
jgi:DNA modification methylase